MYDICPPSQLTPPFPPKITIPDIYPGTHPNLTLNPNPNRGTDFCDGSFGGGEDVRGGQMSGRVT